MDRRQFFKLLAGALAATAVPAVAAPSSPVNAPVNLIWGDWMPYMFWTGSPSSKITLPSDFLISRISIKLPSEMPYAECVKICDTAVVSFKVNGTLFYESLLPYCYGNMIIQPELLAREGFTMEFDSTVPGPTMVVDGRLLMRKPDNYTLTRLDTRRTRSSKD